METQYNHTKLTFLFSCSIFTDLSHLTLWCHPLKERQITRFDKLPHFSSCLSDIYSSVLGYF